METKIKGIIPPLVTPLRDGETVDPDALRQLISFLIAKRVHGVFALGSTGEFPALTDVQKRIVMETIIDSARRTVPVLIGITEPGTQRVLQWLRCPEASGASAFVVAPPYYFRHSDQELISHFLTIADQSPIPLILYNIPQTTQNFLSLTVIQTLADHPNIIGIKDSTGDMSFFSRLTDALSDRPFTVLQGDDHLVALSLIRGASGAINSSSNPVPEWFVALYDAVTHSQWQTALKFQRKIDELVGLLESLSFLPALKAGLTLRGIPVGAVTAPLQPLPDGAYQPIREILRRHDLTL